jgi:hypothetical protein
MKKNKLEVAKKTLIKTKSKTIKQNKIKTTITQGEE